MPLPSGAVFIDIDLEQLDRKSPLDEDLMTAVGEDLYYLLNQIGSGGSGSGVFDFKVNGNLAILSPLLPFRRIDGAFISAGQTLSRFGAVLEKPGLSGSLVYDIRKYRTPRTPITGIDYQYQANVTSITRAGATGSTQSITRSTAQVNTQSISFWKTAINVDSIISVNGGNWRYNLASQPDTDWKVGDYVILSGCTNANNNGTFPILTINDDSGFNITIANPLGVAQTSAAGTANLQAFKYVLVNPASTEFAVGEKALFASHTSSASDGTMEIYARNSGGNNLVVKDPNGVTQGGVAGTIDVLRFVYTLGATVSADIVVGETAFFSGHTSSVNDGNLPVRAVSGTMLTVYNVSGATQGGVAGSVDSNRWIYALSSNPTSSFNVGERFYALAVTSFFNQGIKTVVQINRSGTDNLVVWNESGVTQGGSAGTATHTRRLVKFASDQSAIYAVTVSRIGIKSTPETRYTGATTEFEVLEVNRGGGANFNVVIEDASGLGLSQASPAGRVVFESRSVFSVLPSITLNDEMQVTSTGTLDPTEKTVAVGEFLQPEILQLPTGSPQNLTMFVA